MNRRDFLRNAGLAGAAGLIAPNLTTLTNIDSLSRLAGAASTYATEPSVLDHPASECPVDTVVVLMLENRSFDHLMGWIGTDETYLEAGRKRFGKKFYVDGSIDEKYKNQIGQLINTYPVSAGDTTGSLYRLCGYTTNPGHGWYAGRLAMKKGFLAPKNNEMNAVTYYPESYVPVLSSMARRFSISDRHFASVMGETMPNLQYVHSGTSNGAKDNPIELDVGIWPQETIFDQLAAANVPARFYYTDFPYNLCFGEKAATYTSSLNRYYEDASRGTLPNYSFVEPGFMGPEKANMEWPGDLNVAQAMIASVFKALVDSSQWERSMFVLLWDDWGGFYDHVAPVQFADERSSSVVNNNFGLSGFRIPAFVASPWVERGHVSHLVRDHTSIMRFLQWRFLGAPAFGPNQGSGGKWWLTKRNRYAANLGTELTATKIDPDPEFDLVPKLPPISPYCTGLPDAVEEPVQSLAFQKLVKRDFPHAHQPWLENA